MNRSKRKYKIFFVWILFFTVFIRTFFSENYSYTRDILLGHETTEYQINQENKCSLGICHHHSHIEKGNYQKDHFYFSPYILNLPQEFQVLDYIEPHTNYALVWLNITYKIPLLIDYRGPPEFSQYI